MRAAQVASHELSVSVIPLTTTQGALEFNGNVKRTPASIEKVITAAIALDTLGPAKVWHTKIFSDSEPDSAGILSGNLYIRGSGDPQFSLDTFYRLIDGLRSKGVKVIRGNLVIDRTHFKIDSHDPFDFDGEGNRPYNIGADAFLVNSRALTVEFRPDRKAGVAYIYGRPFVPGITLPKSIPLSKAPCGSWRKQIRPDFANPRAPKFLGSFPAQCGNKDFWYTSFTPDAYIQMLFEDYWKKLGGRWVGKVTEGVLPEKRNDLVVLSEVSSQPLAKIVYDMNKLSINPIARQLFLSLGETEKDEPKTAQAARASAKAWLSTNGIDPQSILIDNGSGLSRTSYLTTRSLAEVLQRMWKSPLMPEFVSSLPLSGVDGTMRKRHSAEGYAHIKTGYISETRSIAGYIQSKNGNYYAVVAVVNGKSAIGSVPVLDAIINWIHSR